MQINLTLFVQVINFAITYWFLNKFMFRPVIAFLQEKRKKEAQTKKLIDKKEQELLAMKHKKENDLVEFKQEIKTKYEFEPFESEDIPVQVSCRIDKSEVDKITKMVKNKLVQRIPHVD